MTTRPDDVQEAILVALAPVHKRALGTAVGLTFGVVVAAVTVLAQIMGVNTEHTLGLLSHFFYGYQVSWLGAAIGFWWSFIVGFVAGWFLAFVRNLCTVIWIFFVRAKAVLSQDFLDNI
jgi:hypothetical protein